MRDKPKTVTIPDTTHVEQRRTAAMIEALMRVGEELLRQDSLLLRQFRREVLSMAFSNRSRDKVH